jgi:hypothetical protein
MSGDFEGLVELGAAAAVEAAVLSGEARTHCPNCGAKFDGPYCAHCGQERDTHRRTITHLLHDFFEDILSFDSRILRTARALVARPGELSCAFRDGRTRAYVPPIRLYFFATLLFFLILSVSGIAILKFDVEAHTLTPAEAATVHAQIEAAKRAGIDKAPHPGISIQLGGSDMPKAGEIYPHFRAQYFAAIDSTPKPITPAVQQGLTRLKARFAEARKVAARNGKADKLGNWMMDHTLAAMTTLAHNPTAINGPLTTWIPRALFLLLPIFAGLLALFHWRQRKSYFFVDHLVFSLNVHSFAFIVLIAAVFLAQVLSGATVAWLTLGTLGLYLLLAMKRFYGQGWVWTGLKFAFLSFTYAAFFLLPALAAVIAVSALQA